MAHHRRDGYVDDHRQTGVSFMEILSDDHMALRGAYEKARSAVETVERRVRFNAMERERAIDADDMELAKTLVLQSHADLDSLEALRRKLQQCLERMTRVSHWSRSTGSSAAAAAKAMTTIADLQRDDDDHQQQQQQQQQRQHDNGSGWFALVDAKDAIQLCLNRPEAALRESDVASPRQWRMIQSQQQLDPSERVKCTRCEGARDCVVVHKCNALRITAVSSKATVGGDDEATELHTASCDCAPDERYPLCGACLTWQVALAMRKYAGDKDKRLACLVKCVRCSGAFCIYDVRRIRESRPPTGRKSRRSNNNNNNNNNNGSSNGGHTKTTRTTTRTTTKTIIVDQPPESPVLSSRASGGGGGSERNSLTSCGGGDSDRDASLAHTSTDKGSCGSAIGSDAESQPPTPDIVVTVASQGGSTARNRRGIATTTAAAARTSGKRRMSTVVVEEETTTTHESMPGISNDSMMCSSSSGTEECDDPRRAKRSHIGGTATMAMDPPGEDDDDDYTDDGAGTGDSAPVSLDEYRRRKLANQAAMLKIMNAVYRQTRQSNMLAISAQEAKLNRSRGGGVNKQQQQIEYHTDGAHTEAIPNTPNYTTNYTTTDETPAGSPAQAQSHDDATSSTTTTAVVIENGADTEAAPIDAGPIVSIEVMSPDAQAAFVHQVATATAGHGGGTAKDRPRGQRHCKTCHVAGHYTPTCPNAGKPDNLASSNSNSAAAAAAAPTSSSSGATKAPSKQASTRSTTVAATAAASRRTGAARANSNSSTATPSPLMSMSSSVVITGDAHVDTAAAAALSPDEQQALLEQRLAAKRAANAERSRRRRFREKQARLERQQLEEQQKLQQQQQYLQQQHPHMFAYASAVDAHTAAAAAATTTPTPTAVVSPSSLEYTLRPVSRDGETSNDGVDFEVYVAQRQQWLAQQQQQLAQQNGTNDAMVHQYAQPAIPPGDNNEPAAAASSPAVFVDPVQTITDPWLLSMLPLGNAKKNIV